jgi:AcrR family transcriptional regulator
MARTQTVSDEQILQAAKRVIWRRGYDAFTLSDVAEEVGLSRAAIILRFQNTRALKLKLTAKMVDDFTARLAALPCSRDGEGLIELARFVGAAIGSKTSTRAFMMRVKANRDDPELAAIDKRHIAAYHAAISARMPKTAIAHDAAVTAFRAHLSGAMQNWEQSDSDDAEAYLVERTTEWLQLAHIPLTAKARTAKTTHA